MPTDLASPAMIWRRHAMGIIAAVLLALGLAFWVWPPTGGGGEFLHGSLIKSGLVLGAAWLAFPQLDRMPGWLFVTVVGVLLVVAVKPRIFLALSRYLVFLAPLFFVIWLLRRFKFAKDKG